VDVVRYSDRAALTLGVRGDYDWGVNYRSRFLLAGLMFH
jgi:hypothetical protein